MLKRNQVRIIGGSFKGRKISFPDTFELRPTSDRIKETLFNWLAPYIRDSICLDLFAGSGALSFEAVSRGAFKVIAIENNPLVISTLKAEIDHLKITNLDIIQADTPQFLNTSSSPVDIIFIDPPYKKNLLAPCCSLLEGNGWVKTGTYIYYEADVEIPVENIPSSWKIIKQKKAGNIHYYLACSD